MGVNSNSLKYELRKVRRAFEKAKQDNLYLSKRIDDLERAKDEILELLLMQKEVKKRKKS